MKTNHGCTRCFRTYLVCALFNAFLRAFLIETPGTTIKTKIEDIFQWWNFSAKTLTHLDYWTLWRLSKISRNVSVSLPGLDFLSLFSYIVWYTKSNWEDFWFNNETFEPPILTMIWSPFSHETIFYIILISAGLCTSSRANFCWIGMFGIFHYYQAIFVTRINASYAFTKAYRWNSEW